MTDHQSVDVAVEGYVVAVLKDSEVDRIVDRVRGSLHDRLLEWAGQAHGEMAMAERIRVVDEFDRIERGSK